MYDLDHWHRCIGRIRPGTVGQATVPFTITTNFSSQVTRFMSMLNEQKAPLVHLANAIGTMSEVSSRVGQYVLANPEKVVHQTVAELAEYTHSGQASVLRLCRQLGFKGFSDFKLALMAELAANEHSAATDSDNEADRYSALLRRLTLSMQKTAYALNAEQLLAIAVHMVKARRISVFGSGISGLVSQLVSYRLMRLGLPAQAFQDPVLAHEVMTDVDKYCVALGISESGVTLDTVEFLKRARSAGAKTIAITGRVNSPVAQAADLVLLAVPIEPLTIGGDISPAISKIYLVELLAMAIADLSHAGRQSNKRSKTP